MIRRLVRWLDDRLGAASFAKRSLRKAFPDHWSFMLGEIALYCFILLVATGTFLSFFYVASSRDVVYHGPYVPLDGQHMSAAYQSVLRISFQVRAGLVMRQIHHWAALVFMAAVVAHVMRIFFTGAFRRPREINWFIGVSLLLLGMGAGFSGYSLPDDLLSGTGLRIAYSVVLSIPFVGTWVAFLFFGGEFPSADLINRLLVLHVMMIPGLIVGALSVHLALVWHQKHTEFRAPGRTEGTVTGSPVWPNFAMKSIGLAFSVWGVLALLGGLFQINAVWLYGPFVPSTASSPAQPDWYVGWLEGAVRLAPNWEFHIFGHTIAEPFLPGVVIPGLFFTILAMWPLLEARVTKDHAAHNLLDRPRDAPGRSSWGAAGVGFMTVLTLAGSNDVLAKFLGVDVDALNVALKVMVLAVPPVAAFATYRICGDLGARELHPIAAPHRATFRRTADGGLKEEEGEPSEPTSGSRA